jgi:hypothetical protein
MLNLEEISDDEYKEMYIASLMLLSKDSSLETAHASVMALLEYTEIEFLLEETKSKYKN